MSKYGKALGTYNKINKIKQSAQKIQEASVVAGEAQAQAISEARNSVLNKNLLDAATGVIAGGASYGMSRSNSINPEMAEKISAGIGAGSELLSGAIFNGGNNSYQLDANQFDSVNQQLASDPAGEAIKGFVMQKGLNDSEKRRQFNNIKESLVNDNVYGYTEDQLMQEYGDIEWEDGSYDFSRLPDEVFEEINSLKKIRRINPKRSPFDLPDFVQQSSEMEAFDIFRNLT